MNKPTLKLGEDSRLKVGGATDARGDRGATEDDRSNSDLVSDDDFQKMLESEFDQTVLPSPPKMPGYHLCWLTTNSTYDPVHKRQRLGYVPVRQSEVPGFDASNGQSLAGFDGMVSCNEMVLFKIEESRYQSIMNHYHHKKPLESEEGVLGQMPKDGQRLGGEDDGVTHMEAEMAAARRAKPVFA